MDSARSKPRRSRVRLGLILGANVLALAVLARVLLGALGSPAEAGSTTPRDPRVVPPSAALLDGSILPGLQADAKRADAPSRRDGATKLRELEPPVRAAIERAIATASSKTKGKVGADQVAVAVHVREIGGEGGSLSLRADRAMRPASNMKLVTTATALALLGPDACFETRVEARGPIVDGDLRGDLVLRAGGDPLYDRESGGRVDHLLAPLIADLRAKGLRSIRGSLVLDEGSFAPPKPGPAWPAANQHWAEFCALAGGFSANRGALTVSVEPTTVGAPANVVVEPRGYGLPSSFEVRTKAGGRLTIQIGVQRARLVVGGSLPASTRAWSDSCSAPDPVALFGAVLVSELERHGLAVGGGVKRERGVAPATPLAVLRTPIAHSLAAINADSTNSVADQLFLATALAVEGEATREAGARATARALQRLGVPSQGLVQVDGSGLSRDDRVSAQQMTELIGAVLSSDPRSSRLYLDSLAVVGESGTLEDRLKRSKARGRVRAKTGFIAGTSALSGVTQAFDGRTFAFSILVEYPAHDGLNNSCWKPMQDSICEILVGAQP